MSYPVFMVPSGDVLPVMFNSYAGSTGASATLTGLAVTDIEIYKDGSVTQRSSDAGYTLLDTDGIDFDSITGLHGFSIDTGDNTDAGFYTVGAWFTVVVSAVTIDSQTVNFIACQFRLMPAESVAGKPKVDVDAWLGTAAATPTVAGVPEVDLTHVAGATTNVAALATNVDAILTDTGTTLDARIPAALVSGRMDASVGAMAANVLTATAINADAITAAKVAADVTTEIQSGLATSANQSTILGYIDTEVASILAAVDTEVAAIKAVTDALGATAAARLSTAVLTEQTGTIDTAGFAPTTTQFEADDITEATADHYNGRIVIFTSGALQYQASDITDYSLATGRGHFTVTALTEAPSNNDTFIII